MRNIEEKKFLSNDIRYILKDSETLFILSDIINVFDSTSFMKQFITSKYADNQEIELDYGFGKYTEKLVSTNEVIYLVDERWNSSIKHKLFRKWVESGFRTKYKRSFKYWLLKFWIRAYEFGDTGDTSVGRMNTKNWRLAVLFNFALPVVLCLIVAPANDLTQTMLWLFVTLSVAWYFLFLICLEWLFYVLVVVLAILASQRLI